MNNTSITYQGIPGSFSYLAARHYFGDNLDGIGTKSFRELFANVAGRSAKFGIIPVENSLAGSIHENYDLLAANELFVHGEIYLRISHQLLGIKLDHCDDSERISKLSKVISHPKALEQCQLFFEHHPHIERSAYSDTAGAAKAVADSRDPSLAAVASKESAELYGLQVISKNIEDNPANYTRFLIISLENLAIDNANKCSLIFTLPHVPASLSRVLDVFASRNLNVTKIESRPIHGSPFEYVFYIDFEIPSGNNQGLDETLIELKRRTKTLKYLGFYRAAKMDA